MVPSLAADDPLDPAAIENGRRLFAQECKFVAGVASLDRLPPEGLPEVAFAGRSNVGKSSLVNALTARRTLARTSNTPGRTQQLNFFQLGGPATGDLLLVDLPGYGYAKVSKTQVRAWTDLLSAYLRGRVTLRRTCVLIDARHGLKPSDDEMLTLLDKAAVPYQVVLTKSDKLSQADIASRVADTQASLVRHPAAIPQVLASSAETSLGVAELRARLAALASPAAMN